MTADELSKLPTYYVMDRDVEASRLPSPFMPSSEQVASCQWMTESDIDFYATEFGRTGFQGGLNWYRCGIVSGVAVEMELFDGRRLDVPSLFIGGELKMGYPSDRRRIERDGDGVLRLSRNGSCSRCWSLGPAGSAGSSPIATFGVHQRTEFGIKPSRNLTIGSRAFRPGNAGWLGCVRSSIFGRTGFLGQEAKRAARQCGATVT